MTKVNFRFHAAAVFAMLSPVALLAQNPISLPTGMNITPTTAPHSVLQPLNPGPTNLPNYVAGQAASTAPSPDSRTLLVLTSGYNSVTDTQGKAQTNEYVFAYSAVFNPPKEIQAAALAQTDPLAGRWRSTDVSAAGVSAIFKFHGTNDLDTYSAVITEGKYRVMGTDTIVLQSKGAREEKLELEWDNPDRVLIDDEAAGKKTGLTRLGKSPDSQHPIVGEWRTTRPWNGKTYPARAIFAANGSVFWITDLRADHGRYSVQDGNIRLEIPNRPQIDGKYALDGNRLALPNPNGGQTSFERF